MLLLDAVIEHPYSSRTAITTSSSRDASLGIPLSRNLQGHVCFYDGLRWFAIGHHSRIQAVQPTCSLHIIGARVARVNAALLSYLFIDDAAIP